MKYAYRMFTPTDIPLASGGRGSAIVLVEKTDQQGALDNSRPMDVHKRSDHPSITAAIDEIMSRLTQAPHPRVAALNLSNSKARRQLREHVSAVVLDLFVAWAENSDPENLKSVLGRPYVAYSRDKNSYRAGTRYAAIHLTYRHTVAAVDGLVAAGLAENHLGFHDRRRGVGRQSRMRATIKLMELLLERRIKPSMVIRKHPLIVLRDRNGVDVDISRDRKANRILPKVEAVNKMLGDAELRLRITSEQRMELLSLLHVDTTRSSVYRVFNEDYSHGGRYYGHWAQNIPRKFRPFLTLSNGPVVELDYISMHPRMLYALARKAPPAGDLYALEGVDPYFRKVIKVSLNTLINARTEKAAINSIIYGHDGKGGIAREYGVGRRSVLNFVAGLKAKHSAIANKFGSGAGLQLQNIDSEIAQGIMLSLWEKGIPSIPLHDSFIVAAPAATELYGAMQMVSEHHLGTALPVEIKHGTQYLTATDRELLLS